MEIRLPERPDQGEGGRGPSWACRMPAGSPVARPPRQPRRGALCALCETTIRSCVRRVQAVVLEYRSESVVYAQGVRETQ